MLSLGKRWILQGNQEHLPRVHVEVTERMEMQKLLGLGNMDLHETGIHCGRGKITLKKHSVSYA